MSLVTHLSQRRRRVVLDLGDPAEAPSVCAALRELGLTGHLHLEVVDEILGGGSEEIVDEIRDRLHLRAHLEEIPDE